MELATAVADAFGGGSALAKATLRPCCALGARFMVMCSRVSSARWETEVADVKLPCPLCVLEGRFDADTGLLLFVGGAVRTDAVALTTGFGDEPRYLG